MLSTPSFGYAAARWRVNCLKLVVELGAVVKRHISDRHTLDAIGEDVRHVLDSNSL
jgi:hypothetical protein